MSFSRYAIEKKQVSTDRGVTWEDVTPSETRNGRLIGVARTLIECEDLDCDLEKWGVQLVDEDIPTTICTHSNTTSIGFTSYNTYLPSGIAKSVVFVAGMKCCIDAWGSSDNIIRDEYHNSSMTAKTATITTGWNATRSYNGYGLNGREMLSGNFCGEATCYNITEFMPWIDPNGTIKMAYKIHYVREHCSNEWHIDEEWTPEFITFGERWVKTYEDIYKTTWQHQIATDILYEGYGYDNLPFQVVWENEGEPFDDYYEVNIPQDVQPIEYLRADGVAASCNGWTEGYQMKVKIDPDNLGNPTGVLGHKKYQYMNSSIDDPNCSWGWYIYEYEGVTKYYVEPDCDYGTQLTPNEWRCVNLGVVNRANFAGFFCTIGVSVSKCGYGYCHDPYISGNILDKTYVGGLITMNGGQMYFPYKIPSRNGWEDEYLNASEYGFIDREGNKIALEYVYGKYTNTSGVTQNIKGNVSTTMGVPSDAVDVVFADSVTSLPRGTFSGNTTLTSVTMNNINSIGEGAFSGCTNLQSVALNCPNTTLYGSAFRNSGLRSIDLSNISSLDYAFHFSDCTSLTGITFGGLLTTLSESMFYRCTSLSSVTIPSSVSTIGNYAFRECSSLSSVTISDGVSRMSYAFMGCTSLRSVEIPSSVISYRAAFWNCSNLEYVTINTTANIEEYTFYNCNIKEVILTVTTPPVCDNGRYVWDRFFTFAPDAVILVPASAVDAYKNDTHQGGWNNVPNMIHPIPNETEWVNIGYTCVDGQRYDYERKRGRNTEYSNDWFWLPEYRTVGEPYGECDGTEPY